MSLFGDAWSGLREKLGLPNKHMDKNITTIEGLAVLIHEIMAGKEDIKEVSEDIKASENRVSARFDGIESRLGKIENLLLEEQKRDVENLKARVKRLEDALAV